MRDYLDFVGGVFAVVVLISSVTFGFSSSNDVIAKKCEKLGAFVVGDKVYECKVKP